MITWLIRTLGILLFGRQQAPVPVNLRSSSIDAFAQGRIELQPYINFSRTGGQYVKFTIKRKVGNGESRSTSLHIHDVVDVLKCIRQLQAWAEDNDFSK